MYNDLWLNLQLFAGEGASGSGGEGGAEGAATGESAVDPGQQRLLELGVPADKIRKNRAYKPKATAPAPVEAGQEQAQEQPAQQAAAADTETEEPNTETKARPSLKEILEDPEYNKEMQAIVQSRLRSAKAAEETLGKLNSALEMQALKFGLDPSNIDYDELAKKMADREAYVEDKALREGVTYDEADQAVDKELKAASEKRQQRTLEEQAFQQHIMKLEQQGEAMKQVFPNFDLRKELQIPAFARMTSPNVGISVEDAYYAVHRKELQTAAMQVTAQKTAQMISNSIASGSRRPDENGTSGQAPSVTTFDYRSMSPERRNALKQRIRSGEKIYPGQE